MLIQTHLRIGDAITKSIPGFQFDWLAFQYGNAVPDLLPGIPDHTMNNSIHFIESLITEITQANFMEANAREKRHLFIQMGILTHYVSDYFCQAHNNDARYQKLIPHILYENRLHFASDPLALEQLSRKGLERYNGFLYPHTLALKDYLYDRHDAYLAEKPSVGKDLLFAAQTSTNIIAAILNYYLLTYKLQAA